MKLSFTIKNVVAKECFCTRYEENSKHSLASQAADNKDMLLSNVKTFIANIIINFFKPILVNKIGLLHILREMVR